MIKLAIQSLFLFAILGFITCTPGRDGRSVDLGGVNGRDCLINDNRIADGQTYVYSPCIKYLCVNGFILTRITGCEDSEFNCYPVGQTWVENCITFTCRLTTAGGYTSYNSDIVQQKCRNYKGICYEDGSVHNDRFRGRVRQCMCFATTERITKYCPRDPQKLLLLIKRN